MKKNKDNKENKTERIAYNSLNKEQPKKDLSQEKAKKEKFKKITKSYYDAIKRQQNIELMSQKKKRKQFNLQQNLIKAALNIQARKVRHTIFLASFITSIIVAIIFFMFIHNIGRITSPFLVFIILALFSFVTIYAVLWLIFFFYIDMRKFKRTLEVERVLPEYLQLVASNMKAGMPIDKALWEAVRPQFGVLSAEIEQVAKRTVTGEDLSEALLEFASKYDSELVEKTVNLIVEGLEAGGNISDLLNKIAIDLQSNRLLRKELSANVMGYVVFIIFAAIIIAPLMFSLSYTLLGVLNKVISNIEVPQASSTFIPFTIHKGAFNVKDFMIFSYIYLLITSTFSAMLISMIRKGNVKESLNMVPLFIIASFIIFTIAIKILSSIMQNVI